MGKNKWLIACVLSLLCSQIICAQTPLRRVISIEELFSLADKNSQSIKSFEIGTEAADQELKSVQANRLPDINASLSGSYWGNGFLWNRDFKDGQSIDMPHWVNNFSISAAQVIYTGGAITNNIAIAKIHKKMAVLDLRKNRQDIRFMLTGNYLELCKLTNQIEVMENNIVLTEHLIANTRQRVNQGTALKNDITRYELQLENMRLQLQRLKDAFSIINHKLITTVGLDVNNVIIPKSNIDAITPSLLDEKRWQQIAENENIQLQQSQLYISMREKAVKIEKSEMLPKIGFFVEEHLDGPITIEVPVINSNFNYWFAGIGIKYNISSLFKNDNKIKKAMIQLSQSRVNHELAKQDIENAVQISFTEYVTSFIDCHTQQKSVELANKNYKVTSDRYENGLALLTDMIDASNMKLSAELNLVNAQISILYNYYKMKYTSGSL